MVQKSLGRFGEKRLEDVGVALLSAMVGARTSQTHLLGKDRKQTKRFECFLANPRVTAQEMLATTGRQTATRVAARHVLAIQDTTELHFPGHVTSKPGFGTGGNGKDLGLFLHPVLGVDAEHGCKNLD